MNNFSEAKFAVVICTRNPRKEYLLRTVESLREQTMSAEFWDLVLVDNASMPPVAEWLDLSWHPNPQIIVEPSPGIASARICGSQATLLEWIVFVDDDNVLDSCFLERCLKHLTEYPELGAFGSYSTAEFESPPPECVRPYLPMLAIGAPEGNRFSSEEPGKVIPWSAGMCIRRKIMEAFAENYATRFDGLPLGDDGSSLLRGEDNEIVFTAWDLGYVTARFADLHFLHLIPSGRIKPTYFLRLARGMAISSAIISLVRDEGKIPLKRNPLLRLAKTLQVYLFIWPMFKKRMMLEERKGRYLARDLFLKRKG